MPLCHCWAVCLYIPTKKTQVQIIFWCLKPWKEAVIFLPGFVKNTFAYSALFVCSNSSHGLELLMEPASVSRPLSMIHSLSPSVRRPLFLPSSSPPLLFSSTLLFLNDGYIKSLTASNGYIQHKNTSQVQLLLCNPPQIFDQLLSQSHLWRRTKTIYNFELCGKVISGGDW